MNLLHYFQRVVLQNQDEMDTCNPLNKILALSFFLIQMMTAGCKELQTITTPNLVVFANGLISPVCITNAGDSRLFVIDQHGLIVIVDSIGIVKWLFLR